MKKARGIAADMEHKAKRVAARTQPPPTLPDLLSVSQAAAELGITERAVRFRITQGTLEATKLGTGTASYVITRAAIEKAKKES